MNEHEKINYIELPARDISATKEFFTQVFGWSFEDFGSESNTALTYAARDGFTEIAQLLVDSGADINWIDGEGVTPLILASFKDHIEIVQLLLDHGANGAITDQWNRTALDYALRRGETDAIAQLLRVTD